MYLHESEENSSARGPINLNRGGGSPHFGEVIEAVGLGIAVFEAGKGLLTGGDFSSSANTVSFMHPGTPSSQTFRACNTEFSLVAHHPRYFFGDQTFWYRLSLEYNGNDLRNVSIVPLIDKSSAITTSKFTTSWEGQPNVPGRAPVAEVRYQLTGRWDPFGRGDVSFGGHLIVNASGKVSLALAFTERDWVKIGKAPTSCPNVAPWLPHGRVVVPLINSVFFTVASDRVVEGTERKLATWVNGLSKAVKESVARGDSPIRVEGFASTAGPGPYNRNLSHKRAERVASILKDLLGSGTKFEIFARGEYTAKTPDKVESPGERRVDITINFLADPGTPGLEGVGMSRSPYFWES
jgi:outer membrane protein OmpA-like peptidoglycan-associated protein